jgi:hypothetical protein
MNDYNIEQSFMMKATPSRRKSPGGKTFARMRPFYQTFPSQKSLVFFVVWTMVVMTIATSVNLVSTADAFVIHPQSLTSRLIIGGTNGSGFATASSNERSLNCHRQKEKLNSQHVLGKKFPKVSSSSRLFSTQDDGNNSNHQNESLKKEEFINISEKFSAFVEMAFPYYKESISGRWLFAGMIAMTLLNSGVSVAFSYVGKDFWNALNSKDTEQFYVMLWRYAAALLVGSPVSVLYTFQRERLA